METLNKYSAIRLIRKRKIISPDGLVDNDYIVVQEVLCAKRCPVCRSLSQTGRLSTSSAAAPRRWCLSCPFTGKEVSHVWVDRRNELLRMPQVCEHGSWHKRAVQACVPGDGRASARRWGFYLFR